jgi:hypothetical protein
MSMRPTVYAQTNLNVWDTQHKDFWLRFREDVHPWTSNRVMNELRKDTDVRRALTELYETSNHS